MSVAPTIDPDRALSPADWLDLWRTVYFDLPLALAARPGRADDEVAAAGGRNPVPASRHPAEAGDQVSPREDFASEFVDRLEGCFA